MWDAMVLTEPETEGIVPCYILMGTFQLTQPDDVGNLLEGWRLTMSSLELQTVALKSWISGMFNASLKEDVNQAMLKESLESSLFKKPTMDPLLCASYYPVEIHHSWVR